MSLLDRTIASCIKGLLSLRYRIRVKGARDVASKGRHGIVFLPNHPALIDPIIVASHLYARFTPQALADQDQIDRPLIHWLAERFGVKQMPDIRKRGVEARPQIEAAISELIAHLRQGGNLLVYPSGHTYRSRYEDLRGNSAVETILREVPEARVVLVRTRGLWGSRFSHAHGMPEVGRTLKRGMLYLLANLLLFSPRRQVTMELVEPDDLPRKAGRNQLNAYLEEFYNQDAPANTYVPYTMWEGGGPVVQPEPEPMAIEGSLDEVPEATRRIVREYIAQLTGTPEPREQDRLAYDLGMDSLARADLVVWLDKEFGYEGADVDNLKTVGDVMLAARGHMVFAQPMKFRDVPARWFRGHGHDRVRVPDGDTIAEVFLRRAEMHPDVPVIADELSGVKTYRDIILGVMALRPSIERLDGEHVGIMLPASVAANVVYLACVFAGKTPVLVNWTTGTRNIVHSLDMLGVKHVLTASLLVARIESQGTDLTPIKSRLVLLDELGKTLSKATKVSALVRSRLSWQSLRHAKISPTAAILLTSGSEAQPKAVPLTHASILANIRATLSYVTLYEDDCMIGFLPPFHSFGLTVTMLVPLIAGLRVLFHANPTEAFILCRLIARYQANMLIGTPTFLGGIIRASKPGQLASLRMAVTGAEKCPERTYAAIAERCPNAMIIEGYGITECSPIVAANDERALRPYTIGKIVPTYEYAVVDVDRWERVALGARGLLLVRGPSVFNGYLNPDVESPFVEFEGKTWYRTGDLVTEDAEHVLTFRGRLKRFVKVGGEMISLPAIEAALEPIYTSDTDEGPVIAVEATPVETHPELVLFTTRPLDRPTVNRQIRDAGLSPLHNIARVVQLEAIPVLGTGKTNYRELRAMLRKDVG